MNANNANFLDSVSDFKSVRANSRLILLLKAAGRANDFACQPSRVRGSQEYGHWRDVLRLSEPPKRGLRHDLLGEIAVDNPGLMNALGLYAARIDGVNADIARTQLSGEHGRNCVHGGFGRGVDDRHGRRTLAGD